jgi:predicted nucleic acid-binding protein
MTFQFRFIPVFVGVNEHFQHYLCNYWVSNTDIHSLGKTITLELAQVFDKIDDSQVEAFIEAIRNAKRIILITFDMIIMILRDRIGITPEEMEKLHRNLE